MEENKNLKINFFSAAMEKEARRLLEKYEHTAEKRLQKAEKQNPRSYFFSRNFVGREFADFWARRHYKKALAFWNQNLPEEAEKEIQRVMKWNPFFAPAWLLKAKLESRNGQYKEAVWCATCALKLDPNGSEALIVRSRAETEQSHFASALADLILISEQFPNWMEPWLKAGLIAFQIGKMDRADWYIRRADELHPSFLGKITMVKILLHREEFAEAEKLCREIEKMFWSELAGSLEDAPETLLQKKALLEKRLKIDQIMDTKEYYFSFLLDLMLSLFRQMKQKEILEVCEEILYFWPETLEAKLCKAQALAEKEELDRALELFKEIMDVLPETPEMHWFIGEILYKQKKFEEALPYLLTAVRQNDAHFTDALHLAMACFCETGKEGDIFGLSSALIAEGIKAAELFYIRGSMFMFAGQIDEAMEDFQKAVRLAPQNPGCWAALAKIYVQKNCLKEAADAAERALKIQPGMVEAGLIRIQALDILGRSEDAFKEIEKLIKNISDPVSRWILKGDFYARQSNFEESRKNYTKALKREPKHPIALLGRARVFEMEEKWQDAYDDISRAIQAAPDISRLYFHRAVYAGNLKNYQQAIEDCEHYLTLEPEDVQAILLLGEIRLEMKKTEAAIVLFQKVLEKDPKNAAALMRCAQAKMTLNLLDSALNDADRAIELAPENDEARVLHLQILIKLNRESEALKYCTEILEKFPENPSIHYNRGVILLNLGHPEEALADFEWVCEHDSEAVEPHYSRALALNALFRHEEAMEALNRVLEIRPDFIPAISEKAMTYSFLGNTELSLKLLDKVLEKTPEDVRLLNFRGTVLAIEDRIEEARDSFLKALEIQPDFVPALSNLGHVQMRLGEWEKGLDALNLAIQRDSKWGRPHLNRALIYMERRSFDEAEKDIEMAQEKAKAAGDEDVLVDAIDLGKKLNLMKDLLDFGDEDDSDSEESGGSEEDSDDFSDGKNQTPDKEKGIQDDAFWKNLFGFAKDGKNQNDWDDDSSEDWEDDSSEDWSEDFSEDLDEDPSEDWGEDPFEDWDDDLDDDWDDDSDEDPEDFDFLVDGKDGIMYLNPKFLRFEKLLNYVVQIDTNIGRYLWPKVEPKEQNDADFPNEEVPGDDESEHPLEMSLTYLDLSFEDNNDVSRTVTPAQIDQGRNFLKWVFLLWHNEKEEIEVKNQEPAEPEEDDETEDKKPIDFIPPIIINCPAKFQNQSGNSAEETRSEVPKGLDFTIPMATHVRYKDNRDYFFEQLMEVGDILARNLKEAKTKEQKDSVLHLQMEFEFLMELIMKNLMNPENEILLVFTNFLTNPIMNELDVSK